MSTTSQTQQLCNNYSSLDYRWLLPTWLYGWCL